MQRNGKNFHVIKQKERERKMLNKPVRTLEYETQEEYEFFAEAAKKQGAIECIKDKMKFVLVNFPDFVYKGIYPSYCPAN